MGEAIKIPLLLYLGRNTAEDIMFNAVMKYRVYPGQFALDLSGRPVLIQRELSDDTESFKRARERASD